MVDAIGANGANVERGVPRVSASASATVPVTPPPAAAPATKARAEAGALARILSTEAPIDAERVARIKRAIATGSFPILPATIADRLLALRLEWKSDDQA